MSFRRRLIGHHGLPSMILGMLCGVLFVGPNQINPFNISWLMDAWIGDAAQNQLSFEFFRRAPLLQWPLTSTPDNVVGANQVIASGNGFSLIAKLVGELVDQQFQFYGLWICMLFALQGYFAERILHRFIPCRRQAILGSLFFIISPAFLYRIAMAHYELAAHFLILWCFDLAVRKNKDWRSWSLMLSMTMFINLYIWVMIAALFAAYSLILLISKQVRAWVLLVVPPAIGSIAVFFLLGYGNYSNSAQGSGVFRANFMAFINPVYESATSWSRVASEFNPLMQRPFKSMEGEGFNFLGIGIIVLLILSIPFLVSRRRTITYPTFAIFAMSCALFIFSLSNKIAIVRQEISVWWPNTLISFQEIFRGTARFSWPLYYCIYLLAIVTFLRISTKRVTEVAFASILFLTLADSLTGMKIAQERTVGSVRPSLKLTSQSWEPITAGRAHLELVPTFDLKTDGLPSEFDLPGALVFGIGRYAIENNLTTNFASVPRSIENYTIQRNILNRRELTSGKLDQRKVYVLTSRTEFESLRLRIGSRANFQAVDGLYIITSNP